MLMMNSLSFENAKSETLILIRLHRYAGMFLHPIISMYTPYPFCLSICKYKRIKLDPLGCQKKLTHNKFVVFTVTVRICKIFH